MWLTGLVAPQHVGSSQTRARTRVPCIGRQTLNHCATREAQISLFLKPYSATLAVNLEEMKRMKPRVGREFCTTENNLQNLGWHLLLCISVYPLHPFLAISFPLSGHSGVSVAAEAHSAGWEPPRVQVREGGSWQSSSIVVCFSRQQSRDESCT